MVLRGRPVPRGRRDLPVRKVKQGRRAWQVKKVFRVSLEHLGNRVSRENKVLSGTTGFTETLPGQDRDGRLGSQSFGRRYSAGTDLVQHSARTRTRRTRCALRGRKRQRHNLSGHAGRFDCRAWESLRVSEPTFCQSSFYGNRQVLLQTWSQQGRGFLGVRS